jgi:hypothetical protein
MNPARLLAIYRVLFVVLLTVASVQTLFSEAGHHVALLAGVEIAAALALLWRQTQLVGAGVLLGVFGVAQGLAALEGAWPTRFLQYAASTLLIVGMGRALHAPKGGRT